MGENEIKEIQLTEKDAEFKLYMLEMESYFREAEARRRLIMTTIESAETLAKENKLQLEWHDKRYEAAKTAYKEWLAEHL